MPHNPLPPWMSYHADTKRPPAPPNALHWGWMRFDDLGVHDLYDALALRAQVFVVEQVAYQDPDGADKHAWHLLARDSKGALQACLRVVDPGVKFAEVALGRVAVAKALRGKGWGRAMVDQGMQLCQRAWPGWPVRISAQTHLQRFYGSFGFVTVSSQYLEDGIPHVEMLHSPGS